MLFVYLLLGLSGSASAACNADNCARAITGTYQAQQSSRRQDCSSYFRATVYPATVTVTATQSAFTTVPSQVTDSTVTRTSSVVVATTTETDTIATTTVDTTAYTTNQVVSTQTVSTQTGVETVTVNGNAKRATSATAITVIPIAIPAYATPCSGSVRYSSACSCAGVTWATTTMSTPTFTVTKTITNSATLIIHQTASSATTLSQTSTQITFVTATTIRSDTLTNLLTSTSTVSIVTPTPGPLTCSGTPGSYCIAYHEWDTACDTLISGNGYRLYQSTSESTGQDCFSDCVDDPYCSLFQFIPSSSSSGVCNQFIHLATSTDYTLSFTDAPGVYSGYPSAACDSE